MPVERCELCGASYSAGVGVTLGAVRCWRQDCPGSKPKRPAALQVVKPMQGGHDAK